jgi:hypothetical protein
MALSQRQADPRCYRIAVNFNVEEWDAEGQSYETGSPEHGSEPLTANEKHRAYLFLAPSFFRILCM